MVCITSSLSAQCFKLIILPLITSNNFRSPYWSFNGHLQTIIPAVFLLYTLRFLRTLKHKIIQKSLRFPEKIDTGFLPHIKTLYDFDNYYSGPIHGFQDANEYYQKCSSINFLKSIKTPTLILNSQNDPFLGYQCFPRELGEQLENVYLDFPKYGGHVGFCSRNSKDIYWSEKRAIEFMDSEE